MTWQERLGADGVVDPVAVAGALSAARRAGLPFDGLLSSEVARPLADAYRVQDQVTALRLADAERLAGWKLGYTSAVMRAQMGLTAPNFGPLTDAMLISSPAVLHGRGGKRAPGGGGGLAPGGRAPGRPWCRQTGLIPYS